MKCFLHFRAGKLDYKIALSATQYLHKEKNYVVWRVALSNLNYLNKVLSAKATYALFRVSERFCLLSELEGVCKTFFADFFQH